MDDLVAQPPRYAIYTSAGTDLTWEAGVSEQVSTCREAATKGRSGWILAADCTFVDGVASYETGPRPGLEALLVKQKQEPDAYKYLFMTYLVHRSLDANQSKMLDETLFTTGVELRIVGPRSPRGGGAKRLLWHAPRVRKRRVFKEAPRQAKIANTEAEFEGLRLEDEFSEWELGARPRARTAEPGPHSHGVWPTVADSDEDHLGAWTGRSL